MAERKPPRPQNVTANDEYLDASLRHAVGLRRYGAGVTKRVRTLLEKADLEMAGRLRSRLARFKGKPVDFTSKRWKLLLKDIREARAATLLEYKKLTRAELRALAPLEAAKEAAILDSAIPIEVSFATVAADQLSAIATSKPFQGRHLREWFATLAAGDQRRLQQAIQLGMTQGDSIDTITRRVVGTRRNGYTDGILATTRRDAQAVVRTAVNHVSNAARGLVWDANSDIISAKIWTATLDGRTSHICQARDGKGTATQGNSLPPSVEQLTPAGAVPPAHINCRSVMVGFINGVGLVGKRPTVTDTRTPRRREIDFRAEAKRTGKPIQTVRSQWADKNIGRVPSDTTYQQFLNRQDAGFQDNVLGPTKGKLFRKGGLEVDQFVDRAGNELTLSQLASTRPEAFKRAGLDPSDF